MWPFVFNKCLLVIQCQCTRASILVLDCKVERTLQKNRIYMKEGLLFTADSPLGFSNFDLLLIERRSPRLSCCLMTACSDPF